MTENKDKKTIDSKDPKNSDKGIILKKIDSTIGVADNKVISEDIDFVGQIRSKVTSPLPVNEAKKKEVVTDFIPVKKKIKKEKVTNGKENQEIEKIELKDIRLPKLKLFDSDIIYEKPIEQKEKPIEPMTPISKEMVFEPVKDIIPPEFLEKTETELVNIAEPMIVSQELPEVIPDELPAKIYTLEPDGIHELPVLVPLDKLPEALAKQFHEKQHKALQEKIQKEIEGYLKGKDESNIDKIAVIVEEKKEDEKKAIPEESEVKVIVVENIDKLLSELNTRTKTLVSDDTILESLSFLGDIPKIRRISYKAYDVKNLYERTDELPKKAEESQASAGIDSETTMEGLVIPDVVPIEDKVVDTGNLVSTNYSETNELRSQGNMQLPLFVDSKSGITVNKTVEDNINKLKPEPERQLQKQAQIYSQESIILTNNIKQQGAVPSPEEKRNEDKEVKEIYIKKDLTPKREEDKNMAYILPSDAGFHTTQDKEIEFSGQETKNVSTHFLKDDKKKIGTLVYSTPLSISETDPTKVFEKYSLDDFTYVGISYVKDKGLFYNIVQPELTPEQNIVFSEIKKIFFNTIDQNFYTFKGDKYSMEQYTSKIFDISVSKLSYQVNSLDKKLYYKFIQREFSGLGILTALFSDKHILEVSCAGEKTNVVVYHINYGTLETNISFESIQKLNQFVMILTKNMGLYVNSAHPIIDGYLPNGYKVEGLYSVGELSSKGSSFVIKKYLEEPITPVSLINSAVGTIDIFAYIWCAINEDYRIILTGDDDSFLLLNSIALLYPDKKIVSIQSYDRIKLPQKQWIKRVMTGAQEIDKKTLILHTLSERPDYLIVDEFGPDLFDVPWYSINLYSVNYNVIPQLKENMKLLSQKAIIIYLKKIKVGTNENIQITKIDELIDRNEFTTVELSIKDKEYNMNLLSSTIDIVEFYRKKKYMRWLKDTRVYDYRDFNNIINEFALNEEKVVKRLGIDALN